MDENESGEFGDGGHFSEQFDRNEEIIAVVDEEDDDYEDFHNDVNVDEDFLK